MSKNFTITKCLLLIFIATACTFAHAFSEPEVEQELPENKAFSPELMLIGGGLKLCASNSPQHCSAPKTMDAEKVPEKYHLSKDNLAKLKADPVFSTQPPSVKLQLNTAFEYFYANELMVSSVSGIFDLFTLALGEGGGDFFISLPNDIYFALLDFTQVSTAQNHVFDFNNTESKASREILTRVISGSAAKAKSGENVKLVFLTSGKRDALNYAHYYQSLFNQLAAQYFPGMSLSVHWLPLDVSLAEALRLKQLGFAACSQLEDLNTSNLVYDQARIWPDLVKLQQRYCDNPKLFKELIESAHGLYIADGNTDRLVSSLSNLESLIGNPIKKAVSEHKLFVVGNGAGAQVVSGGVFASRPIPIITGGKTDVALIRGTFALSPAPRACEIKQNCPNGLIEDDLTYKASGSLNILPFGIIDTRVSEQEHIGRLALLAAQSKTRFGIGIDGETALLMRATKTGLTAKVLGSGGVMLLDMQDAIFKSQSGKHQLIGLSHYINDGDTASFNMETQSLDIVFEASKQQLTDKIMVLQMKPGEFRRQVALNCGMTTFHRWTKQDIAWLVNPGEDTRFASGEYGNSGHCSYSNLLFGIEN